jgi:hypothetical protein
MLRDTNNPAAQKNSRRAIDHRFRSLTRKNVCDDHIHGNRHLQSAVSWLYIRDSFRDRFAKSRKWFRRNGLVLRIGSAESAAARRLAWNARTRWPGNQVLTSDLPRVTEGLLSAGLAYRDLGGVAAGAETADRKASSFSVMVAICSDSFFVSAF